MADKKKPTTDKKIDELYDLIQDIEVAMMTTRRTDGRLVSRAMATQERAPGADVWFVTDISSDKLDELATDPHVNLAYYNGRTREWVSVSGTARMTQDRAKIEELYKPDWKAWFGDEGGAKNGEPGDPRMALIAVDADSVMYTKKDAPMPVVLFEIAKAMVTGENADKVFRTEKVEGRELHGSKGR